MAAQSPAIEWVNHASFLTEYGDVRLLADPWLEGTAFKDGWQLIAPTRFEYADFGRVSHIWLSHQHPDHFAPTNLRAIPPEVRRRITILYQTTDDKLVVSWCRSAGFGRVIELPEGRWFDLADGFRVKCATVVDDSWLAIRAGERTLLNLNDCVLNRAETIEPIAGAVGPVDLLFTQFSYAQWIGNPPDRDQRVAQAREKLERIRLQDRILRPAAIVPFASYVYFCHDENFYMNDAMNAVGDVARFVEDELKKPAMIFYPGDTWRFGEPHDWRRAAQQYAADTARAIANGPTRHRRKAPLDELLACVNGFLARLRTKNKNARYVASARATVYVTDADQAFELSMDGMRPCALSEREADIATSAENIMYAFRTPWGGDTLRVSGRFRAWTGSEGREFFTFVRQMQHYNVTRVDLRWLREKMRRAVRGARNRIARTLARRLPRRIQTG